MSAVPAQNGALESLLALAAYGFPLLPLHHPVGSGCSCGPKCKNSPGKHPRTPKGVHDATTDAAQITRWFNRYPNCNWGAALGRRLGDGYTVGLDVDPRSNGDDTLGALIALHGPLPDTVTQLSGGNGQHYLFLTSEPSQCGKVGLGIDLKGAGGYIVVTPSKHQSGKTYEWEAGLAPGDVPIAAAPEWLGVGAGVRTRPPTSGVDARNTLMGETFAIANLLGERLANGCWTVKCPWFNEHSDGRGDGKDSSTVILPATVDSDYGGFKCQHGHCSDRGGKDVQQVLGKAFAQAKLHYPDRKTDHIRLVSDNPNPQPVPNGAEEPWEALIHWKTTKGGGDVLEKDEFNLILILTHHPAWAGKLRWNAFRNEVECTAPPFEVLYGRHEESGVWSDQDETRLRAWLENKHRVSFPREMVSSAVMVAAQRAAYHPVRDWLKGLTWDGVPRVEYWLHRCLGAEDSNYTRAVGKWWLTSAVARVMKPGCKADHVLILEGAQGIGKSTALRLLAGDAWFSDTQMAIGNKDAYLQMRGKWLVELGELASMKGKDAETLKAFFSSPTDSYRPPYGRNVVDVPRQMIFCASTNLDRYFSDNTGNRRGWPVVCTKLEKELLCAEREQLWAEAACLYAAGECWYPRTKQEIDLCAAVQESKLERDETWQEVVEEWLTKRTDPFTVKEILEKAFMLTPDKIERKHETKVGIAIATHGGWARNRDSVKGCKERVWRYHRVGHL